MLEVLKIANLRSLWMGQVLSLIGTRMFGIALSWWILSTEETHAGLKMGILLIITSLPAILFSKKIGYLADHTDVKKIILKADALAGITTFLLAFWIIWVGKPSLGVIYFVSFLLATFGSVIDPSMNKIVNKLATQETLEKAVALLASTSSFSFLIGAVIGATAIGALGLQGTIWVNGLSYVLALLFTLKVKGDFSVASTSEQSGEAIPVQAPYSLLPKEPILKKLLIGFAMINFFSTPIFVLLPIFVKNILKGNSSSLALLEGSIYLGGVLGAMFSSQIFIKQNLLKVGIISIFVMGSFLFSLGFANDLFLACVFVIGAAGSIAIGNVKFVSYFQMVVPDAEKGRFFASLSALCTFAFPVAFFLFGFLADYFYVSNLYFVQGTGVLILSLFFYLVVFHHKPENNLSPQG